MVRKSEFAWNVIGSVCTSLLSVVLLFVVTRVNGVDPAGMFSITFATSTVLYSIGDFGMRVYQVTDSNRQHGFGVYLTARFVVDICMVLCGVIFVIISGYTATKAAVCLGLVGFRFVDAASETYQGEFQLNGRLDIGGKSVFYRTSAAIAVFMAVDIITKNVTAATMALLATNAVIWCCYDIRLIPRYTKERLSFKKNEIAAVIKDCFPLFFSTFFSNYIVNAPKYAIDKLLTYDMQTYFNIIYLPTFTINLMSTFVLKPLLKGLGELWNGRQYRKFLGIVAKMGGVIAAITLLVEAVCYVMGIPILAFIYSVELKPYKTDLLILVLSGGFFALSVALFYALTTMRSQKIASLAYIAAALAGTFLPNILVTKAGLRGAAISSCCISAILTLLLSVGFVFAWRRKDR